MVTKLIKVLQKRNKFFFLGFIQDQIPNMEFKAQNKRRAIMSKHRYNFQVSSKKVCIPQSVLEEHKQNIDKGKTNPTPNSKLRSYKVAKGIKMHQHQKKERKKGYVH